jgi:RNA ligase
MYDFEDLVLLAAINTNSGDEVNIHNNINEDIRLNNLFENLGFKLVMVYKTWGEGYDLLKEEISKDKEGYVIKFKNGFRMKIKGVEYVRLHKILTNISNRDIWEYLKDDKPFDEILDKVPDEFYSWVKDTKENILNNFKQIEGEYQWIFKVIMRAENSEDRKTFASFALRHKHPSILFSMFDNKDYKHIIWKIIYPNYSKPFKKYEN